jgi:hypothetical protein
MGDVLSPAPGHRCSARTNPAKRRKEQDMKIRAAIGFTALTLALAGSAPASAHSGCTDRAVKGTISVVVHSDRSTVPGTVTGTGVGVMSHLGRFVGYVEGRLVPGVGGSGPLVIVAANGDRLTGTSTFSSDGPPLELHTTTTIFTVTGGTGRFADASGQMTIVVRGKYEVIDPVTFIGTASGTVSGRICY